jgi:phosphoribosylglycinamide formyltransferase-1
MITRGSDDSKTTPRRGLALGVLISGGGSTLANLIERTADGRLRGVTIRLVISSRSRVAGVDIARRAGLPVEIVRRRDLDEAAFSKRISALLDAAGVDLVVMGGFLCQWRLPPRYAGNTLNIHPALLPAFGGRGMYGEHVHRAVLASGATESGCTVHLVDALYDHGPIIAQRRVPVLPDDTPASLAQRVAEQERELYPWVIQQVADNGPAWLRPFAAPPHLSDNSQKSP